MKISVIIPVYNAAKYIRQAVDSALAQPETGEILLYDDASADGSANICKELAAQYEQVIFIDNPEGKNRGSAYARNICIRHASCDYIAFLDADDYYLPHRFRFARPILESSADIDGVYDPIKLEFESQEEEEKYSKISRSRTVMIKKDLAPEALFAALLTRRWGNFSGDGLTVRKSIFEKTGLFDESLELGQDMQLWMRMAAVARLVPGGKSEPVTVYRLHPGVRSAFIDKKKKAEVHYKILASLIPWLKEKHIPYSMQALAVTALYNTSYLQHTKDEHITKTQLLDRYFPDKKAANRAFLLNNRISNFRDKITTAFWTVHSKIKL